MVRKHQKPNTKHFWNVVEPDQGWHPYAIDYVMRLTCSATATHFRFRVALSASGGGCCAATCAKLPRSPSLSFAYSSTTLR